MANSITYAGIELNLDTDQVQHFVDEYLSFDDARWTLPERSYPGPRLIGSSRAIHNIPRPRLRLGQWFYPVGMSRWSELHLLLTEDNYNAVLAAAFSNTGQPLPNALTLTQNDITISTNMYLLSARPISRMLGEAPVFVASFVDERYFFSYIPVSLTVSDTTTWQQLIDDIASELGITVDNDPILPEYLQPEPNSDLNSNYENGALLADCVGANVGMRWVRLLDGTYYLQNTTSASSQVIDNKQSIWIAGGDAFQDTVLKNGALPKAVIVSFLKWNNGNFINPQKDHIPYSKNTGDEFAVQVLLSSVEGFASYIGSPATKVYHSTARANFTSLIDVNPANLTDLQNLAQQIASDFYNWLNDGIDQSFPLLCWQPEGYHDIIWRWDKRIVSTRVMCLPWNFGVEELLHGTKIAGSGGSGGGGGGTAITVMESFDPTECAVTFITLKFSQNGAFEGVE